jgi:hypothetical protein
VLFVVFDTTAVGHLFRTRCRVLRPPGTAGRKAR